MPRRNRRQPPDPQPLGRTSIQGDLDAPPGWAARRTQGLDAPGDYVCPRCHRGVRRTSEHVVAWPSEPNPGPHRHWHTTCWQAGVREGIERFRHA